MAYETYGSEESEDPGATAVCRDHMDGDLDAIFLNWQFLAAAGWRGFQTLGCGAVVVNLSAEYANVSYASGMLAENYTRFVERYDPRQQLVIVVRHATGEHAYLLNGQPPPQECFETGSLHAINANVNCVPCNDWEQ